MYAIAGHARRLIVCVPWRQWLTVLIGAAVVAGMVLVAETARSDAERHLRAQVLVERVRADAQALGSIQWQALATAGTAGGQKPQAQLIGGAFAAWRSLNTALAQLQAAEPGTAATQLQRDARAFYDAGMRAFMAFHSGHLKQATQLDSATLLPLLATFDANAERAAESQADVARQASGRAAVLYVGSLVVGLSLLLLVGWRVHRYRRRASLAQARLALELQSEQRVRALVEHSSDVITVVDQDLTVLWQSPSVAKLLGYDPDRLLGEELTEFVHPEDRTQMERLTIEIDTRPGALTLSARFHHADGAWRDLEVIAENRLAHPAVKGIVLSMRDVTARKALENELRHQALHDALTGLANRALFEDRLVYALARARRHGEPVAVLFLDLDDFKTINDSLGHETGDELLRAVASRIDTVVRASDTAARLGGDEFAILAETLENAHEADTIANRLLEALALPFEIGDRELRVSVSIGLARSDGSLGVKELMRDADTAMYAAKESGKNTIQVFEAGMHRRVLDRLELTGELQRGIEQQQFELDYQPVVALETGRISGAEALVRWAHPQRGRLAPVDFIPLAEETGLIVPLGAWILKTACAQAARWTQHLPEQTPFEINVNVSTRQLHDPAFPEVVRDVLADTGLAPRSLVLEITESVLPPDGVAMAEQLQKLKGLGVLIAVDDFGTGYSALARLHHFPIDIVKIDRSFITGIEHDCNKAQLVRGIVSLAESLDLTVVAEGLEYPAQVEQVRGMRARHGQGYLFSRPVPPEGLWALLQDPAGLAAA